MMRTHLVALAMLGSGCATPSGGLEVMTYGEAFIEQQIPAAREGSPGFVDEYHVVFERFLYVLSEVTIANGTSSARTSDARVFDLHRAGPHVAARFEGVAPGRWDRVGAVIAPAEGPVAGNARPEDVRLMAERGYSVYVEGYAQDGRGRVRFAWGFDGATRYEGCAAEDGAPGVLMLAEGPGGFELTLHGDHLFYDDLQSETSVLRFAAFAEGDADGDGEVTLEELERVELSTLPKGQYGVGEYASVTNLRGYLSTLSRLLLHFEREGSCDVRMEARAAPTQGALSVR